MYRHTPCIAAVVALLASDAFAQLRPFDFAEGGFHRVDPLAFDRTYGHRHVIGLGFPFQGGAMQGGRNWTIGPFLLLSLGSSYHLLDSPVEVVDFVADAASWNRKRAHLAILAPGISPSGRSLAYTEIGFEVATVSDESSANPVNRDCEAIRYRLGMSTFVGENIYLHTDIQYILYSGTLLSGHVIGLYPSGPSGWVGLGVPVLGATADCHVELAKAMGIFALPSPRVGAHLA